MFFAKKELISVKKRLLHQLFLPVYHINSCVEGMMRETYATDGADLGFVRIARIDIDDSIGGRSCNNEHTFGKTADIPCEPLCSIGRTEIEHQIRAQLYGLGVKELDFVTQTQRKPLGTTKRKGAQEFQGSDASKLAIAGLGTDVRLGITVNSNILAAEL